MKKYYFLLILLSLSISTFYAQVNDDCANATNIDSVLNSDGSCNLTTVYDNTGATFSSEEGLQSATCTNASSDTAPPDIWYTLTVPPSGEISFDDISTPGISNVTEFYTGSCGGGLSPVPGAPCNNSSAAKSVSGLTPGETLYIRIWDFGQNDFGAGEFCVSFEACPSPSGLASSLITDVGAQFDWTASPVALSYEYIIQLETDTAPDETITGISVGTNNVSLDALTPNTEYTFYVRSECAASVFSGWSSIDFATLCSSFIPDYFEAFDTFTPDCWNEASTGDPATGPMTLGTGGWINDEYRNGPTEQAVRLLFNSNLDTEWALSPVFDLSAGGYQLDVSIGLTDSANTNDPVTSTGGMVGDDEVQLLYSVAGGAWTNLFTWNSSNSPAGNDEDYVIDLSPINGQDNVQFAFWGNEGSVDDTSTTGTDQDYDFFFDNFQVRSIPSCGDVTNLSVNALTSDTATIDFDMVTGAVGYNYDFGVAPYTQGTNASQTSATNSIDLTGLIPQTEYQIFVQSDCGSGTGTYVSIAFTTECATFTAPFNEDFSAVTLPACWSQGAANQEDWLFDDDPSGSNVGNDGAAFTSSSQSGGGFAWVDDSNSPEGIDTRLETPFIDVSSLAVPSVSFYFISNNQGDTNVDFRVEVWDGSAWNQIFFSNQNSANAEWQQVIVDISNLTIIGDIKVAFIIDENLIDGDFNDDVAIDDVSIDEAPSCLVPVGLSVANITLDAADMSWTAVPSAIDGYNWSLYNSGDDPLVDTAIDSGNTTSGVTSVNLSSLSSATTYDFYVESNCGVDGTSGLSPVFSFTTLTLGLDCSAAISAVVTPFGDVSQSINIDTTDLPDMSSVPSCEGFDSTEQGLWYEFTTNNTDGVVLSLQSGAVDELEGAVYDSCGGTELFCFADGSGLDFSSDLLVNGLMPNTTYILQLFSESFNEGSFTLAITDLPLCTQPVNLNADGITSDAAMLNWDIVSNATSGYSWSVYTSPSDPSVDTAIASGTTSDGINMVQVTGLMEQTEYDFYISSNCGADGVSNLAGPSTFTTDCAPFMLNISEDFSSLTTNVNTSLSCWSEGSGIFDNVGSSGWGNQTFNNDSSNDNGNGQSLYVNLYNSGGQVNDFVTTPAIDLGAGDPNNVLSYDVYVRPWSATAPLPVTDMGLHSVSVVISTDGGLTWDLVNNTLTTYDTSNVPNDLSNTQETISLAAYSGLVKFGFLTDEEGTATDLRFYVDNLFIGAPPVLDFYNLQFPSNGSIALGDSFLVFAQAYEAGLTDASDTPAAGIEAWIGYSSTDSNPSNDADWTWVSATTNPGYDFTQNNDEYFLDLGTEVGIGTFYYASRWRLNNGPFTYGGITSDGSSTGEWGINGNGSGVLTVDAPVPASVQVIHNSADPSAEFVDVYINGALELDNLEFRTATTFVELPAGVPVSIDVAPSTSIDVSESIYNLTTTLASGETYVAVANGVIDPTQFDSSVNTIDFNLDVFAGAQEVSTNAGETSLLINHGSTDAPAVDVVETSVPAGTLANDISYSQYQGYVDVPTADYVLNVELADNSAVVASYEANLATLGTSDLALTVLASGFLDPAANQNGAAFGLWVALPSGGDLVELPFIIPAPVNDNVCDATPLTVGAPSAGDAFTNVSATVEANEPGGQTQASCNNNGVDASVWFTFEAPSSGDVLVTTDILGATLTDTEIAVYEAPTDCTDLTTMGAELACDQDSGVIVPNNSIITSISGLTPGSTYYIQVDQWGTATPGSFGIRVLDNNPPCPEPTNLNVTGITDSSAVINWDDITNATLGYNWSVYAAPSDPSADTPVASGTTSAGVTTDNVLGLMPQTDYDLYVSSDCDVDGVSILSGPTFFTTDCGPAALNYEEDFTGLVGDINVNLECWNEGTGLFDTIADGFWVSETFNLDAANDNGNGTALRINLWNSGAGVATDWVTTQSIDLGAGSPDYVLSYDTFVRPWTGTAEVTDMGTHNVRVVISTDGGSTWDLATNTLVTYDNSNIPNNLNDTFESISLAAYSGVVKIGFISERETTVPDLRFYIDNVFVGVPPVCNEPTILNVSNVGFDSAELNWTGVPEATNGYIWSVYISPSDPSTDTPVATGTVGSGVETDVVNGLIPETTYDFYVNSDCDIDGTSDLAGPVSFTTGCAPFTPNYLEDFTTMTFADAPNCWIEAENGDPTTGPTGIGTSEWVPDGFLNDPSGTGSARLNLFNTGTSDWLISPTFDLSAGGYEVVFDIGSAVWAGTAFEPFGSDDVVQFLYSDDNGATWNVLITWAQGSEPSNSGELSVTDLSGITGSSVQFAFWGTEGIEDNDEDVEIYIDNFEVRTPPTCPEPLGLSVSNLTPTTADLSWVDDATAANGYNWSVFTSPSDPAVDTPVASGSVGVGVDSAQATGLTDQTTYDFYVSADCDTNGFSTLAGPITFTTPIAPVIVNSGVVETETYCYNSGPPGTFAGDFQEWLYQSFDGSPLVIEFIQGSVETFFDNSATFDDLLIYDGQDDTGTVLFNSDLDTTTASDLTGLTLVATSGSMYITLTSDGSVSCDEGDETPIIFEVFIETPSAQVQIIHNSADPMAQNVDIYINDNLEFANVAFRTATAFVDLPAETAIDIDIAPAGSTSVMQSLFNLNTTLLDGESYIVVANGVLDPMQFDSSINTIDFNLSVFGGAQQTSTNPGETSVLVHHGSTDAPAVDIVETSVPLGAVADDITYPLFQGYVDVPTADYIINVELADNSAVVATYEANLASAGVGDLAVTVLASGFLNPAANQNGPAFGLWAALPTGGPLLELPLVLPTPMSPAPDPTEAAADVISLFSGVYTNVSVDTFLTPWSQATQSLIQIQGNDTQLYENLDFAGIETVSSPVDASGMDFFHIDVWSPNATTFRVKLVNDLGGPNQVEGEIAFNINQEEWVSLQIPLTEFADPAIVTDPNNLLTGTNAIAQYIISGLPAGAVVAYVDNIYFSKTSIGVAQFDDNNFSYYPNPVNSELQLETQGQVSEVKVFNMLGQMVMTDSPNSISPKLNVEELQSGTYIMNVTIDGVSKNFKFVKE